MFLERQLQLKKKKNMQVVKICSRSYTEKASFRMRKNASIVSWILVWSPEKSFAAIETTQTIAIFMPLVAWKEAVKRINLE